jgi:RimJ/RimL family protein N-acetyltransferase
VISLTLEGTRFRLRPIRERDLDYLRKLRNHPETRNYLGDPRRISAAQQKSWFRGLRGDAARAYYLFEMRQGNSWLPLGMARTHDIDRRNRSMGVGGDIAPAHRGKHYGRILYRLIFELGFRKRRLHRLWLLVLDDNDRARQLYRKLGFREVGVQREAIRRGGRYHDYILMDILAPEAAPPMGKSAARASVPPSTPPAARRAPGRRSGARRSR